MASFPAVVPTGAIEFSATFTHIDEGSQFDVARRFIARLATLLKQPTASLKICARRAKPESDGAIAASARRIRLRIVVPSPEGAPSVAAQLRSADLARTLQREFGCVIDQVASGSSPAGGGAKHHALLKISALFETDRANTCNIGDGQPSADADDFPLARPFLEAMATHLRVPPAFARIVARQRAQQQCAAVDRPRKLQMVFTFVDAADAQAGAGRMRSDAMMSICSHFRCELEHPKVAIVNGPPPIALTQAKLLAHVKLLEQLDMVACCQENADKYEGRASAAAPTPLGIAFDASAFSKCADIEPCEPKEIEIMAPAGAKPGMQVCVTLPTTGRVIELAMPPGTVPGASLNFIVPPAPEAPSPQFQSPKEAAAARMKLAFGF